MKTNVINSPKSIRDFNEKLHSLHFAEYMTDCLVTSSLIDIESFLDKYNKILYNNGNIFGEKSNNVILSPI